MTDSLIHAYMPLVFWIGLGILSLRLLPESLPRVLGRSLYWVGIPIEIFALARQSDFGDRIGLTPMITVLTLLSALGMAWLVLQVLKWWKARSIAATPVIKTLGENFSETAPKEQAIDQTSVNPSIAAIEAERESELSGNLREDLREDLRGNYWLDRHRQGSFLIASILGNTGFVGLAVAPAFISSTNQSWLVFYNVTQNVLGTYTIGVLIASYFGRQAEQNHWWMQLRDVLTVPSIWGFVLGISSRAIAFPAPIEIGLRASIWIVIPAALILMGMRLSQLRGWQSLRLAIAPAVLKVLVMPSLLGIILRLVHFPAEPRLALVLMAGMPSAFAGLILAEEYDLDRDLIASSIVWTTGLLLVTLPVWLWLFRI